ncbi:Cna B-type domain-containing protein [uncultured Olsenella sp.]|uniref:Cna B-type domain-containing protein n=1 Tax=uncultured Olsenella sp. TaxID=190764 RepID=UPI0026DCA9FD|nr:Cna B-type domain-containing protein [uncultured Olsenella sp.]
MKDDIMRRHEVRGLRALALLFLACVVGLLLPARTYAAGVVDTDASCTITLSDCKAEGQRFTAYRVASMGADGKLSAVPALAGAVSASGYDPADLTDETSAATLEAIAQTYSGYVVAGASGFESTSAVAASGSASLTGLKPGMYLITADTTTVDGTTYISKPYLISVPAMKADGTYAYARTVRADKVDKVSVEHFENKVIKLWKGDSRGTRPSSVTVQIFDGTRLYNTVELNSSNDWSYAWEGKGDWSVREVTDTLGGYTCSISSSATVSRSDDGPVRTSTFMVTNSHTPTTPKGPGRLPKTGDPLNLPLVGGILLVGLTCIVVGVYKRRDGDGS